MTTETIRLLTIRETAEVMRVHPRTVWRYIAAGRLPAVRHPMNRRVYLRERDVHAALETARHRRYGERPEISAK